MNRASFSYLLLLPVCLSAGCAQWKETPDTEPLLSTPRPSPTASIIDIGFVPLPIHEDQVDWRLWNDVDEQVLSESLRQELADNGLRAGRIVGRMPDLVAAELKSESKPQSLDFLEQANLLSDVAHGRRRFYCRSRSRYELPVRKQMRGEVSLLTRHRDSVTGWRLIDPLFQFSLETRQGGNGEVILRMVPEIKHGDMKQSWISNEQALRLEARRDVHTLEKLAIEIPLQSGQAVLIAPTAAAKGLGEKMLIGPRVDSQQDVVAVVLRLTQEPRMTANLN